MADNFNPDGLGVFLENINKNIIRINTVDIDVLCVISKFQRGPINKPTVVTNFDKFVEIFGDYVVGFEGWLQVFVYFNKYQGRKAVIVNVAHYGDITDSDTLTVTRASTNIDDKENVIGELAANITDTDTTIPLVDASLFPTSTTGGAYILIGTEQITYTGKTGNNLTGATRGANATVAAAHLAGASVTYVEVQLFGAILTALWGGAHGNDISYTVEETSTVDVLTMEDLLSGATTLELESTVGIEVGDVLSIDDGAVYVQVTSILNANVNFDAVTLLATIPTGSTVVNLRNTLNIYYKNTLVETWTNVSMWRENSRYYIESVINQSSTWVTILVDTANQAETLYQQQLAEVTVPINLTGGSDGTALLDSDFIGYKGTRTGLYALDLYKGPVVISMPDSVTADVQKAAAAYARDRVIYFFINDMPYGQTYTTAKTYSDKTLGYPSETGRFVAMFWPNILIKNPVTKEQMFIHPSGSIVGKWAAVSGISNLGPWQTAAGPVYGVLNEVLDLERNLINGELVIPTDDPNVIAELQKSKINPLIFDEAVGFQIFGSLTNDRRAPDDPNAFLHYANTRTFQFVQAALKPFFGSDMFLNNTPKLRDQATQNVKKFLTGLFLLGAFPGESTSEAFSVQCDDENNTKAVVKNGDFIFDTELAKHTPVNRIKLRFSSKEEREAVL